MNQSLFPSDNEGEEPPYTRSSLPIPSDDQYESIDQTIEYDEEVNNMQDMEEAVVRSKPEENKTKKKRGRPPQSKED